MKKLKNESALFKEALLVRPSRVVGSA